MYELWQAWQHAVQIRKIKKQLTHSCKAAKQARLHTAVEEAQAAAQRHDLRSLYKIIRTLTPKQPFKMIRLRGSHGEALTAEQECQQLESHFAAVFQSPTETLCPPLLELPNMPFSQEDLCHALLHAPVHKAVAPGTLPNLLLRSLAPEIASWLWLILQAQWCSPNPSIPQPWKDALALSFGKKISQASE